MLEFIRKNAGSKVVWLIIAAIALVFVFFGVGGGGDNPVIKVNGERLNPYEFDRVYKSLLESDRGAPGGGDSPNRSAELKQETIAYVVNNALSLQFAKTLGLDNSPQMLRHSVSTALMMNPNFQKDGAFDKETYERVIRRAYGMTPATYEQQIADNITIGRFSDILGGLAVISPAEYDEAIKFKEASLILNYAFFPAVPYMNGLSISNEELEKFFEANKEYWRLPARIKLEYVEIKPADFENKIEINDQELLAAYDDAKGRFTLPERVELKHILFAFKSPVPTEEDKAETLKRAEDALAKLKSGGDFAALAKESSDDRVTAERGGILGRIGRGQLPPNLDVAIFNEAPADGTPFGPVESQAGYHIFEVENKEAAGVESFDAVKDLLAAEITKSKALELARNTLEDLISRAELNPDLREAADSLGLGVQSSALFAEVHPVDFLAGPEAAAKLSEAFKTDPGGGLPRVVESPERLVLYKVAEREDSRIPEYDAALKTRVLDLWTLEEAMKLARADAEKFLTAARDSKNWGESVKTLDAKVSQGRSPALKRLDLQDAPEFKFTNRRELAEAVASLAGPGSVADKVVTSPQDGAAGYYVVSLYSEEADETFQTKEFSRYLKSIMVATKAPRYYVEWLRAMHAVSKVDVPQAYYR